jgi:hypothetical protein
MAAASADLKKVCIFHFPPMENFFGYSIDTLSPLPYFPHTKSRVGAALVQRRLLEAKYIDQMYREKHPAYMRYLGDFVDKFKDADLVVLASYNPVHPEVLFNEMPKPIKVLGFVNDPVSTYSGGIQYLWPFDGAFYISPSYNHRLLFEDALKLWGCDQSYWWPLVPPRNHPGDAGGFWPLTVPRAIAERRGDSFFRNRDIGVIYIGGGYSASKIDRLAQLKKRFGSQMHIYGRWRLKGYPSAMRWLAGRKPLWPRVRSISDQERTDLYCRTKIGIDLHFSDSPMETGNMRMYEVPAHGLMLLCDKGGLKAHEQIFQPDKEAVYYDSVEDAIEKIEYYLAHDDERERIARAGFARVHRDYDGESNLKKFLDWAIALPRKTVANRDAYAVERVPNYAAPSVKF